VLILGIIYFVARYIVDCHLLLNLYKREIESSGKLVHNARLKVIYCLLFFQLCIILKFVGSEKYLIAFIIGFMFVLTIIVCILYSHRFLRPQLFKDEEFRMDSSFIHKWSELYSQHIERDPMDLSSSSDKIDKDIEKEIRKMKFGSWVKIN